MNQYYGAYPPQSLTPQQAAALGGWQNNQNLPENGELAEIRDKLDEIKRLVQKKSRPYRKEPYKHGKEGLNHEPNAE